MGVSWSDPGRDLKVVFLLNPGWPWYQGYICIRYHGRYHICLFRECGNKIV